MSGLKLKSKRETIKFCDQEIQKTLEQFHMDPKPNTDWYWASIDRLLDIRIQLMGKAKES